MVDDLYVKVGARIKWEREQMGMTQAELAEHLGLGRTSITNIELGTQSILLHQLLGVARALHVEAGELLKDLDAKPDRARYRWSSRATVPKMVPSRSAVSAR